VDNGLLLPVFEPEVARHFSVVLVGLAVASLPSVILVLRESQPAQQLDCGQLSALCPVGDVVDDLIARVVRDPAFVQRGSLRFFSRTLASKSSSITSFFWASFASSCRMRLSLVSSVLLLCGDRSNARAA